MSYTPEAYRSAVEGYCNKFPEGVRLFLRHGLEVFERRPLKVPKDSAYIVADSLLSMRVGKERAISTIQLREGLGGITPIMMAFGGVIKVLDDWPKEIKREGPEEDIYYGGMEGVYPIRVLMADQRWRAGLEVLGRLFLGYITWEADAPKRRWRR